MMMIDKIIVYSQELKDRLLKESEYIHDLEYIDIDKAGTLMYIYMNPDIIEVNQTKKCELIAVDRCITILRSLQRFNPHDSNISYYLNKERRLKKELEKLKQ
jgi:hypothetical protein